MVTASSREHSVDRVAALVGAIWRQVLGRLPAAESNFLREGGDSLLATRLVSRLNQQFGIALTPRVAFEAPTVGELTARVRREVEGARLRPANEYPEARSSDSATLSFSQERMWFMHALASASAAYNIPLALRLRGPLDVPRLKTALQRVVERHAVLSATFPTDGAEPKLQPGAADGVALAEIRLDVPPGQDPVELVVGRLGDATGKPFDLERGPLFRATLFHIGRDDAVLLIVMHHIVGDLWSFDLLCQELAQSYVAIATGGVLAQPSPVGYERYAAWHRRWFTEHRLAKELEYWRCQLAGLEPVSLTGDFVRPPHPSFRGAKVRIPFDRADFDALARLGAERCASLAMVLLAALDVLLYRHTGRSDIAVGVPVANRHRLAAENLVGVLVNTLVARTSLEGNPDFATVLGRVRATMLDVFDHQDMPFELLVRELQLPRDSNRSPLFSIMFNMLNTPPGVVDFGPVACSRLDFDRRASQFDLTVTIDAIHDRSICFEYSTDVFARATVERLARHYVRILRSAMADATLRIAALPMLEEHELELLSSWGRGPSSVDVGGTVPQLLQQSFRGAADSIALRFGEQTITYAELDAATERVAHALRSRGIGRGARVGLCLWRSPYTVIAQVGILRSGAAYVALDSSYPADRLAYMTQDSGLLAVVSQRELLPVLSGLQQKVELLDVESMLEGAVRNDGGTEPASQPLPDDPAYVIYTSGTTGKPKGVEVPHRAVVNFLRSMAIEPGLTATDRLLAVTTLSFDISVLELLLPLTVGAEVIIARREQLADGVVLGDLISSTGATVMQATPSTWRILIDSGWSGSPTLKVLVGGEPLTRQLASELLGRCSELWNMYGPTETTVWSTCWKADAAHLDTISIGSPIANTDVHVLDANFQPMPIGAAGELFIGGAGLARGYVNQPELTAQRFIDHPLRAARGRKLYRTGDRARWRHDGTLEHMGRLDSQVKIRGHRIELGEIETRLAAHPGVAGVVAGVAEDERGDACIVAYVVPEADMIEPGVFRSYLQQWLPSYMVPQYYVELDAIPLLASGKIDRVGLANASTEVRKARATVLPRTEREAAIHRVWSGVLANDQFGVHDSFFDLGGHSLLAVRVAARITRELNLPCALPMLFRFPTVAALAAALAPIRDERDHSLVTLQTQGDGPAVFCISGVEIYQALAARLAGFPVHGLFTPMEAAYWSARNETALPSVRELAADYLRVVREHQPAGPYVLAGFSFGGVIAYEMAQQLTELGMSVPLLVILDSDPPRMTTGSHSGFTFSARPIRTGTRALLDLGRRFGGIARAHDGHGAGSAVDEGSARLQRYSAAMRHYRARPYRGQALLIESAEERAYDPGHGWDALIEKLAVRRVSSAHVKIFEAPHLDLWSQELLTLLRTLR